MHTPDASFIEEKVQRAINILAELGYREVSVSSEDFTGWINAEKFAPDKITMEDIIASDNLMVHEVAEINEIKKQGHIIDSRVLLDSPREDIYRAHLTALELELEYLLMVFRSRLGDLKQVVYDDEFAPEAMKDRARELHQTFKSRMFG